MFSVVRVLQVGCKFLPVLTQYKRVADGKIHSYLQAHRVGGVQVFPSHTLCLVCIQVLVSHRSELGQNMNSGHQPVGIHKNSQLGLEASHRSPPLLPQVLLVIHTSQQSDLAFVLHVLDFVHCNGLLGFHGVAFVSCIGISVFYGVADGP